MDFIMKNADQYLQHAAGVYALLAWNEEQQTIGTNTKILNQTLFIHPLTSRFFSLGISKKKGTDKKPFLAIQPAESYWMSLINWDYACIRERDLNFYLVSQVIKGDNNDYPDIPAFAIALSFDTVEKINLLKQVEILDGREYRQESGQIMINFHNKVFNVPVKKLNQKDSYLENTTDIVNYDDLLTGKEQYLQSVFSTQSPPQFLGDENEAAAISNKYWKKLNDLLDKTNPKK